MEELIERMSPISRCMDRIQSALALDFLNECLVDVDGTQKSLGRVGILGCFLGATWGIHFSCGITLMWISSTGTEFFIDDRRVVMACTWCFYITAMCTFHLLEFFITAFFNPTVVASDSFLVNHSKAYTVAAITAGTEFWVRFFFGGDSEGQVATNLTNNTLWMTITILGIFMVISSQILRSCAMMKCGESFNHYIQTLRKENHVLVTDGIYGWFRHPSYIGFYYWSIGTQLVLRNPMSGLLFALAGWKFFSQRIPYEERSLIRLFGDQYYDYISQSYVGIPFIPSIPKDEFVQRDSLLRRTDEGIEITTKDETKENQKKTE
mmetsp:Transcript_25788/g.60462  ORF Transcript_25788/g.60462 Transcript_25788/m.60462 type:complete len:322 (-) Transcript_25788:357-1322(-)|eukprot:CAMPEP_0197185330 /NCGR_PEP_ID=MMETSP1423-20130617/11717_1 /TAXON_ID=476441 /ORGANISM="Pseudo-nitzschia heimii, Strain UNC1101" /LENGTH=321 /DNA_ID=CAMNT_0042636363 /DNA_START=142 /DNA_END=1107 /DNA_ORIENTATION=-